MGAPHFPIEIHGVHDGINSKKTRKMPYIPNPTLNRDSRKWGLAKVRLNKSEGRVRVRVNKSEA